MPKKTAAPIELTYNDQDDKPPNLEAVTKQLAEEVRAYLLAVGLDQLVVPGGAADKGKLLIVDGTGAAAFKAMKGDATISEDGTIVIGEKRVTTAMLAEALITTAKLNNGSVTLAKLAEGLNLPESYLAAAVKTKLNNERVPVDGSVTLAKLAELIPTSWLKDGVATEAKHGDASVTSRKLKPTFVEGALSEKWSLYNNAFASEAQKILPGTEKDLTVPVAGNLLVNASADFLLEGFSADNMQPEVAFFVDGVQQGVKVLRSHFSFPSGEPARKFGGTFSQTWVVPVEAGARKLGLKGRFPGSHAGLGYLMPTNTSFVATLYAS